MVTTNTLKIVPANGLPIIGKIRNLESSFDNRGLEE